VAYTTHPGSRNIIVGHLSSDFLRCDHFTSVKSITPVSFILDSLVLIFSMAASDSRRL
jgi:hypothetical protein